MFRIAQKGKPFHSLDSYRSRPLDLRIRHRLVYRDEMALPVSDKNRMGMEVAYANAKKSYDEGGIPIGAALVYHSDDGGPRVVGAGHNARIQKNSPILHGEIAALEGAGRLKPEVYRNSTMVSLHAFTEDELSSDFSSSTPPSGMPVADYAALWRQR